MRALKGGGVGFCWIIRRRRLASPGMAGAASLDAGMIQQNPTRDDGFDDGFDVGFDVGRARGLTGATSGRHDDMTGPAQAWPAWMGWSSKGWLLYRRTGRCPTATRFPVNRGTRWGGCPGRADRASGNRDRNPFLADACSSVGPAHQTLAGSRPRVVAAAYFQASWCFFRVMLQVVG